MKNILHIIFFLATVCFCYGVIIENNVLRTAAKPIPLLILIFLTIPQLKNKYNLYIFLGFILSLAGDIFLLNTIDMFIAGLVSFLIAHIFYISAFLYRIKKKSLISSIPFYSIAVLLSVLFYPYLEDMAVPVIIYIFVIMTMVWRSYVQRKYNRFAFYAFIGATVFAVSDSNIALTKFVTDYDFSKIITIILYWSAQFLIYISIRRA